MLKPGYKADVNIIDYDALALDQPKVIYDLPAGGRRLDQTARGYAAMIVSGKVVYRNGQPTGELPAAWCVDSRKSGAVTSVAACRQ